MKEFKGLKVPEFKPRKQPKKAYEYCDIMTEGGMCVHVGCSDCIFDGRNFDAFNEWKLSNKDKDAK